MTVYIKPTIAALALVQGSSHFVFLKFQFKIRKFYNFSSSICLVLPRYEYNRIAYSFHACPHLLSACKIYQPRVMVLLDNSKELVESFIIV